MEPVSRAVYGGVDRRYCGCRFSVLKTSNRDTANRQYRYSRGVCHRLFYHFQEIESKAIPNQGFSIVISADIGDWYCAFRAEEYGIGFQEIYSAIG